MTTSSAEERQMLVDAVRSAASGTSPRPFLAEDGPPGTDDALWQTLSQQIGLSGLLIPEELGGAGAGVAEVTAVLGELAAQMSPVPALSSLGMAAPLLAVADDGDAVNALRTRLGEGTPATVCWPHPETTDLTPTLRLTDGPDGPALTGEAQFVLDGMAAEVILAPAACGGEVSLVAVEAGAHGIQRTSMTTLDLTRSMATINFDHARATALTTPAPSADAIAPGLDIALTCMAAEQVGVASCCHDDAVAWAKERVQFDRTIGSFQAIKHTLVDLLQDLELARSALDVAVAAADAYLATPGDETAHALRIAASMAKAMCGDAATRLTDETLHIFGGIGFTWEHGAHLYFRRARSLELLLGAPDTHRVRLAAALGVGA